MYFIALILDLGEKRYPQGNYSMMGTSTNTSLKRFLMVRCIFLYCERLHYKNTLLTVLRNRSYMIIS